MTMKNKPNYNSSPKPLIMRKTLAFFALLFSLSLTVFAQTSEVDKAFTYFNLRQPDKAKESIDKATSNDRTKDDPKTWAYRSLIYSSLALGDSTKAGQQDQDLAAAQQAIEKTKQLDKKGEYKINLDNSSRYLAQIYAKKGIAQYNAKDFKNAAQSFKYVSEVIPNDTTWMVNTAVASYNAQDYDQAIQYYSKVMKIKPSPRLFELIAQAQGDKKDSASYIKTVQEGLIKFPQDNTLITEEINYYLNKGQTGQVMDKLKIAIDKDPKNSSLYVVLGSAYEKVKKVDSAEAIYKKAVAMDPKNFAANFNLGAIYYNKAALVLAKANKLPRTQVKQYNLEVARFKKTFEEATPYLEAAHAINPSDQPTISSLREIYARTNQTAKAAALKSR